jgi:hypothetical protein
MPAASSITTRGGTAPIFYLNGRLYDFAQWRASDDNVDNQATDQPELQYFH